MLNRTVPVKQPKRAERPSHSSSVSSPWLSKGFWNAMARHRVAWFCCLIRIIATYTVFSHTYDEPPTSPAAWSGWTRCLPVEPQLLHWTSGNRPGPYLLALDAITRQEWTALRCSKGPCHPLLCHHYDLTLALARLEFAVLLDRVLVGIAGRRYSAGRGGVAVFLFSFLPPILAHAGCHNRYGVTAFLGAAFLTV